MFVMQKNLGIANVSEILNVTGSFNFGRFRLVERGEF